MIVANWKANGDIKKNYIWCETFQNLLDKPSFKYVGITPSHMHFHQLNTFFKETNAMIGMQDIYIEGGAITGSISAEMASADGCSFCLVGHSERREIFNEDTNLISKKIISLLKNNIKPILCIGESFKDHKSGKTKDKLKTIAGRVLNK